MREESGDDDDDEDGDEEKRAAPELDCHMGEGLNVARDGRKSGERRKMTISLLRLA